MRLAPAPPLPLPALNTDAMPGATAAMLLHHELKAKGITEHLTLVPFNQQQQLPTSRFLVLGENTSHSESGCPLFVDPPPQLSQIHFLSYLDTTVQ